MKLVDPPKRFTLSLDEVMTVTRLRWVNAHLPKSPIAHARRDDDRSICAMAAAVNLEVLQEVCPTPRSVS